jgi:hypothetical protein
MLPTRKTRGFTLIATLMLLLMSDIAIGLLTIWGGQTLNYKGSMASLYYFHLLYGKGQKRRQHYLRSPRLETTSSIISSRSHKPAARNAIVP